MLTETTRKMASVQEIEKLSPIEHSDFLETAEMKDLGWKVVVKKGEFHIGQKVVYFEIDSAINVNDLLPCMEFLKNISQKKLYTGKIPESSAFYGQYVRIKTIKLRGQISQGLIISLDTIAHEFPNTPDTPAFYSLPIDYDLTKLFNVEVYDRLVEWYDERSQLGPRACCHSAGNFPCDVPKTDETRLESLMKYFHDPEMVDAEWECTEKNDGSSCTLFYRPKTWPEDPMKISSRRFILKDDGGSDDWFDAFKRIGLDTLKSLLQNIYDMGISKERGTYLLPSGHEIAIQGEMIGPKFNGNRDKNQESHFRVFRIFDITEQKFVSPETRYAICKHLGLEHVKVIETCKIFQKLHTIDEFEEYVDRKSDNGNQIEGVVFKRVDNGEISFKKVSKKYLMKNGD